MPEFEYAIIIPAWNEAEFIQACITSVQDAMDGVDYSGQLIVVDNNSTDNTADVANAAGAQVVFEPINQISRARNAGAAAADAPMYVFVDADSRISAELLKAAIDGVVHHKRVGGGANIRLDRPIGWQERNSVAGWNWYSRQFKLAAGCFVYCRADAFADIGGFSLKRYAGEELLFSKELRRWGRSRDMQFHIITEPTIETSARKLDWYTPGQMFRQFVVALLPGAFGSRRLMSTWYDDSTSRTDSTRQSQDKEQ